MKFLVSLLMALCFCLVYAQDEEEKALKHQIGIAPIAYEGNFQLNSIQHFPKLKSLFYYENRFHPNFSWRTELGFAPNIINDQPSGAGNIAGKMFLIEFQTGIGMRYIINGKMDWPLKFFAEANLYYNGSNLRGTYYWESSTLKSTDFDESFHVAGTRLGLGLDLELSEKVNMTLGYFARMEFGWGNTDLLFPPLIHTTQGSLLGQSDFGFYPVIGSAVIRIGYRF